MSLVPEAPESSNWPDAHFEHPISFSQHVLDPLAKKLSFPSPSLHFHSLPPSLPSSSSFVIFAPNLLLFKQFKMFRTLINSYCFEWHLVRIPFSWKWLNKYHFIFDKFIRRFLKCLCRFANCEMSFNFTRMRDIFVIQGRI